LITEIDVINFQVNFIKPNQSFSKWIWESLTCGNKISKVKIMILHNRTNYKKYQIAKNHRHDFYYLPKLFNIFFIFIASHTIFYVISYSFKKNYSKNIKFIFLQTLDLLWKALVVKKSCHMLKTLNKSNKNSWIIFCLIKRFRRQLNINRALFIICLCVIVILGLMLVYTTVSKPKICTSRACIQACNYYEELFYRI